MSDDKIEITAERALQYTREGLRTVFSDETAGKLIPLAETHNWTTGAKAALYQHDLKETFDPTGDVTHHFDLLADRIEADASQILRNDPDVELKEE